MQVLSGVSRQPTDFPPTRRFDLLDDLAAYHPEPPLGFDRAHVGADAFFPALCAVKTIVYATMWRRIHS